MTGISGTTGHWFGLCRRPPTVYALQTVIGFPTDPVCAGQPAGGGDGSGPLCRGIGAALAGMRTLNRNRQLLWFTLLAGLVLVGNTLGQGALNYVIWTMQPAVGETEWFVLTLVIEFATLFCLLFLLTGLVLSIPAQKGGRASVPDGLSGAKKQVKTLLVWSAVLAFAGMLLFSIYFYPPGWLPRDNPFPKILGTLLGSICNPLMEFPFNPALTPSTFFNPARDGGISPVFWIYPNGIMQTLIFSEINLILFILTPFVVPAVVLEKKTLRDAVAGTFSLMKRNWEDAAACTVFLGVVVSGVVLSYLLVQAASGMAVPDGVVTILPNPTWIALALVYDSALFCFAVVMATVGGIAALDLYRSAKSRQHAAASTGPAGGAI